MCGIVGYVGPKSTTEVLLGGLRRLEYRGYDSAGISVIDSDDEFQVDSTGAVFSGIADCILQLAQ